MAKRFDFQSRDSKSNASMAFSQGASIRVQHLRVNPVTHKFMVVDIATIRPVDYETLTQGILRTFGVIHGQRERLTYAIGS